MIGPGSAWHDFALSISTGTNHANQLNRELWCACLNQLARRSSDGLLAVEWYGHPQTRKILVLLRFERAKVTAALRQKCQREAQKLSANLMDIDLWSAVEQQRFYAQHLAEFPVRQPVGDDLPLALAAFCEKMERHRQSAAERLQSAADLAQVVQNCLFSPQEWQTWSSYPLFGEKIARQVACHRAGRRIFPWGGRRADARFETCIPLELIGFPQLNEVYAVNLSQGGLFARTKNPLPVNTPLRAILSLSTHRGLAVDAQVAHARDHHAALRRYPQEQGENDSAGAGMGLKFLGQNQLFRQEIENYLASLPVSPLRALIIDSDLGFGGVLADALAAQGWVVEVAAGQDAQRQLAASILALDLVVLNLHLAQPEDRIIIQRARQLRPRHLHWMLFGDAPHPTWMLPATDSSFFAAAGASLRAMLDHIERALHLAHLGQTS